jgi:arogenate dehydrogenase (NADP+)
LVQNTSGDSFDLYYGLFMFNKNSLEMLERLDLAFEDLRKQLIAHLHDVVRNHSFEDVAKVQTLQKNSNYAVAKNAQNGSAIVLSSKNQRYSFFKSLLYSQFCLVHYCHVSTNNLICSLWYTRLS